jgi:hypothetical protein
MPEATTYDAYLELAPDGAGLAQVLDLPGCFGFGPNQDDALAALGAAIPDYYAWLRAHDEYTPVVAGPFAVAARERMMGLAQPCSSLAFFVPDAQPVGSGDLDWLLALLRWATGDLTAVAVAHAPLIHHIAESQWRDLAPLDATTETPPAFLSAAGVDLLAGLRDWTEERLRAATADDLARVEERDGHRWSARWALRRAIVHARWHSTPGGGIL